MPCGFQTMSDNSLRNRTWAGSFKSPHRLCCLEFAFSPAWKTAHDFRSVMLLFYLHNAWRLPGSFAGRQDGGRFCFWPVEAHDEIDRVVRRGQPVTFLVRAE